MLVWESLHVAGTCYWLLTVPLGTTNYINSTAVTIQNGHWYNIQIGQVSATGVITVWVDGTQVINVTPTDNDKANVNGARCKAYELSPRYLLTLVLFISMMLQFLPLT